MAQTKQTAQKSNGAPSVRVILKVEPTGCDLAPAGHVDSKIELAKKNDEVCFASTNLH
jgi:hypothetical protein